MKTITPSTNRALSGNGHRTRGHGNGKPSTYTIPETAPARNGSKSDFALKVAATEMTSLQVQIQDEQVQGERWLTKPKPASPWLNPTQFERPVFLMNFPFSYATDIANNQWMKDLKENQRQPDYVRAAVQFLALYRNISAEVLVYLLPTPQGLDLQDLVYTANLGIVLEHLPDRNTVVISNFTTPPRRRETAVGVKFFQDMGYNVHVAPAKFEGEAELKHLHAATEGSC